MLEYDVFVCSFLYESFLQQKPNELLIGVISQMASLFISSAPFFSVDLFWID